MRAPPPGGLPPHPSGRGLLAGRRGQPGPRRGACRAAAPDGPRGCPLRRRPRWQRGPGGFPGACGCRDALVLTRGFSCLDAAAVGTGEQRRCGWERRCQLAYTKPGTKRSTVKRYRLIQDLKLKVLPPTLLWVANTVVKFCHKREVLILMFLSDLYFCMPCSPSAT